MSKTITREIKNFAENLESGKKVLDIGCGLRPYEAFFKRGSYTGIDVETSGRKMSDKAADVLYDGLHIPFPDKSFDIALCTQVLEHCVEPHTLLSEIHRILKDGGVLFLTVPFIWGEHETPYDFRRYSSFGIKKAIEEGGFRIVTQKKLTAGSSAIESLVGAEITNSKHKKGGSVLLKIQEFFLYYLWRVVLRLWQSMYQFDRIYLDNLIIAKKD